MLPLKIKDTILFLLAAIIIALPAILSLEYAHAKVITVIAIMLTSIIFFARIGFEDK